MMRRITALTVMVLAAACADVDTAEDTVPPEQPAGVPPEQPALPPDDADVRSVDAVLAEWSVTLSQDSVQAGPVAFNVQNTGTMVHRFEVEGNGEEWESEDLAAGGSVTMSLNLSPGEYKVYCPIEAGGTSHEERGMTTTLRVY